MKPWQSVTLSGMARAALLSPAIDRMLHSIAILFIVIWSMPTSAQGQSSPKNEVEEQAQLSQLRTQITAQRAQAEAAYAAEKQACYQRFSVNACLVEARDKRNALIADLKRQSISLNDADRKRKAADTLQRTEEKTSPQVVEQQSLRRGAALLAADQRKQRAQEKSDDKPSATVSQSALAKAVKAPRATQKREPRQAKANSARARSARAADAKMRYEERQKQAANRATEVQKKAQKRTKPAAQPLPIPGD